MAFKMSYGRKFWACIVALVLLMVLFFITLFANKAAITSTVVLTYGAMVVTVCFAYVGGNVWNKWIKSKFFHSELAGK